MAIEGKMEKIISLSKRRGFIYPGSEIYGGLSNSWDFGPLGIALKKNIKDEWWRRFVDTRPDMVGIESALLMNPKVWEASGHLKEFSDPLVECKECHERFRADKISGEKCPNCGGALTPARQFNLMLKTFLGPVEEAASVVYFRPETAQGMFVNFENVVTTSRRRLPFGIAQIGKAFRNEITPGNYIFRTREFEQMEIEYFVKEGEWEKYFDHWLAEMKKWVNALGLPDSDVVYEDIPDGERAHYSKRTIDVKYQFPFGLEELYGLAYRGNFDLTNHKQTYLDPETNERFVPHCIEPTWGVERTVLAVLSSSYYEDTKLDRVLLRLPYWLAPVKVAVFPLMKKPELVGKAEEIAKMLRPYFPLEYDETGSVGKRYRRQDEIGTPFCLTIDFDSLTDDSLTVRERDSSTQERVKISNIISYLHEKFQKNRPA